MQLAQHGASRGFIPGRQELFYVLKRAGHDGFIE